MKTKYFSIRKSVSAVLLMAVTLCSFTSAANATTFYISPSGNDITGNGSVNNPWKTLYKAASVVSGAGDIIHVNAGTYTETAQVLLRTGVSVEGDGISSVIKSTLSAANTAILSAQSAEGTKGNQFIANLKFDGNNRTTAWAIEIRGRSNVSIHNCTIIDFDERGVYWSGRVDGSEAAPSVYATGNTFYNNTVINSSTYSNDFGKGLLNIGGQDGMLIYNNTLTQTGRALGTNGYCIKYVNDGYLKGCKIYNNTITKEAYDNLTWDFAVELFHVSGVEVYNNTVIGAMDFNYQPKLTYAYSLYIHDNIIGPTTLQQQHEHGVIFEYDCESIIIEKNTFRNLYSPIYYSTRNLSHITDNEIAKNLCYNIGTTAGKQEGRAIMFVSDGSANYSCTNLKIYNNTFVGDPVAKASMGLDFTDAASITNTEVKNNLFVNFSYAYLFGDPGAAINTMAVQNNNVFNCGYGNVPKYTGVAPTNLTYTGNLSIDPLFIGNGDYSLKSNSPCIDAGVFVGLPYAGAAPDRGYAEAGAILPIKLLDFSVVDNKGKNLLHWKTATEINSDHFTIQRSTNGVNFETVGTIQAAGFSNNEMDYDFTDADPAAGANYYRLIMVDKDNIIDYSNVVSIFSKKVQSMTIANAQLSSAKSSLSFTVNATQNVKALLMVFDANGRSYLNTPVVLQPGLNRIDKNISAAAKGIYYVRLVTADEGLVKNVMATE